MILVSASASQLEVFRSSATRSSLRIASAFEVAVIYAGILLYIWRWQFTYPRAWMPLLAGVLLTHLVHGDSLRELGLGWTEFTQSARLILPLTVAILLPATAYGVLSGRLSVVAPQPNALRYFAGYALWCCFQQYLAQSFFHTRLVDVVQDRHHRSLLVGVMFGAAHIPNPILMVVTTFGGFVLAAVFARRRNIWPLALAQAVAGSLLATLTPAAIIHNMRVGPGYFFYGIG
jgi:hypothetical protein